MPDMAPDTLQFNDHLLPCPSGLTLQALLASQGLAPERVATAVDARFVPRTLHASTALQPGDHVVTFEAIVGG